MASAKNQKAGREQEIARRDTLEGLLGFQLRRAQLRLFQHFEAAMAKLAVTPGQAGVLILIEDNPGISQAALARALDIERATLGETIDKLQDRHWVERRRSASDGRSLALYLSASGRKLMPELHCGIARHEADICSMFSAGEADDFMRLLVKFNRESLAARDKKST